jgi:hypothetical protein
MLKFRMAYVTAILLMLSAGVCFLGPVNVDPANAEMISAD